MSSSNTSGYISHQLKDNRLRIETSEGQISLTGLSNHSIEVVYSAGVEKAFPSFSKKESLITETAEVVENEDNITFNRGELSAIFSKTNLNIRFYLKNKFLSEQTSHFTGKKLILEKKSETNKQGKSILLSGFSFALIEDEKIMGGGERILGMDRRGHRMPLYNKAHYGYQTESNQMNFSLPAIMSSKKYAILFDNSAKGYLDIGKTNKNELSFEAVGGRMAYIIFAGKTYPDLINEYVDVTGKQPLPPRWAFGNFSSRFGYTSQKEVMDTVKLFEDNDFPLDSVIIDLYWFGKDIKGHMGNLAWDKATFPNPEKMIQELHQKNIKTILVTEPFILSSSSKWQEAVDKNVLAKDELGQAKRFDFYFGNTGLIDVFDENSKNWFSDIYTGLSQQGVAGVWGDLGEPEVHPDDSIHNLSDFGIQARGDEVHNAYGHEWGKMVYQNHRKIKPNTRPFMMMRSGFAGSQRYGMIPWTGDVERSWKGLKPQVELSLQMSLFGMAYTHSDLGGFAGGTVFDKELYIRWLQYGVFQPIYRPHAQAHIPPEPVYHDEQTKDILREFVKLRYQLLPYNYTLAFENSTTGMPLMRPVFFEDESNLDLINIKNSYLWGDAFFVTPVTEPAVSESNVTESRLTEQAIDLPKGVWFDYWNDTKYIGDRSVNIPVTIKTIPVMVRAGSFIPMIDSINNTEQYSSENLTLHYYADESVKTSQGQMYEDDGISRHSIKEKKYDLIKFSSIQNESSLVINFENTGRGYKGSPVVRTIKLLIHNFDDKLKEVSLSNEASINKKLNKNQYHYSKDKRLLEIEFLWDGKPSNLTIKNINKNKTQAQGKPVIYQVFTRLFGNKNKTNKPWGTLEENGVGKFNDFTDAALKGIKEFGTSHIWYTGVPHHAVIADYTKYGISNDDPDIVKGRAGSPYAVKDYYNVNPDLAVDPAKRLEEFKALIERTHKHGMKVIIDIVPNHIARDYQSLNNPKGIKNFGEEDDTSAEYKKNNNFYYIVGENFQVPRSNNGYQPLNGEAHKLADNYFKEEPAKWTGNGSRKAQPDTNDWYETVKVNYGVKPDGSYDFDRLPSDYANRSFEEHQAFWESREIPDSWKKFRDIVLYWTEFGVDGFRYDMAEMVPVEFWSYLNSSIKLKNPDATLIAEVYNPSIYRDFISLGKMDYLYDKVDLYDTLKGIMQGKLPTSNLLPIVEKFSDIDQYLLHFLENHDEQRIASDQFAGDANMGKPAMVVSALLGKAPTMLYYGQALGENGDGDAGFGDPSRTTIFDYWGVPSVQRWMNDGLFDGGQLSDDEKKLREFYTKLLSFSANSSALTGEFTDLHRFNLKNSKSYNEQLFSFSRWNKKQKIIVVTNFSKNKSVDIDLEISAELIKQWELNDGNYQLEDILTKTEYMLKVGKDSAKMHFILKPLDSKILKINQ